MTDGGLPTRRPRQWIGVTAVAVGIAGAAVAVPPLIAPGHDRAEPRQSRTPQTVASGFQPGLSPGASPSLGAGPSPGASPGPGASPTPGFAPISIQAEDPANTLTGGASATACGTCRGGRRVRYMCAECTLVVRVTLPSAGTRTVTVYYEADGNRALKVRIGTAAPRVFPVTGPDWSVPQSLRFTANLPAGEVRLTLFNDESPAPDLDEIVIA
ncbi:hypothetical protein ACQP1P_17225 [Dactylosporangium sp. CA-052675]|uniref:hypothetical protein n=1 Tax=Dactylosporangium sp. CA-052675 TaxID=3239927 RepID=UPI003D8C7B29